MNSTCYKCCLLSLGSLLITVSGAIDAKATEIEPKKQLSFSNIFNSSNLYLSKSNRNASTGHREYTFKAPDSTTTTDSELTQPPGYKVEVYGSAEELLLQVRNIEPRAFVKGDVIQVGIFSQQNNAEDMVRKLASVGLWARIIPE